MVLNLSPALSHSFYSFYKVSDGVEGEDSAAEDDQQADTTEVGEETAVEEAKTDENESNLELAWEMLDLARVLYEKQEGREFKLKAAQCRLKLGEVSIESGKSFNQPLKFGGKQFYC